MPDISPDVNRDGLPDLVSDSYRNTATSMSRARS
jgi:hypothetical protein